MRDETCDLAARPDGPDDGQLHRDLVARARTQRHLAVPRPVQQERGPDLVVVEDEGASREKICGGQLACLTDPEPFACRFVQVDDATLIVDDADEIRSPLDVREQLRREVGAVGA